jgi:hypothetical protein
MTSATFACDNPLLLRSETTENTSDAQPGEYEHAGPPYYHFPFGNCLYPSMLLLGLLP